MNRPFELNLKHLHALVAVHHHGGISAAAPHVNLSQPALTQAIARLETQLDATLFDRQPGGMAPTEAAELLDIVEPVRAVYTHMSHDVDMRKDYILPGNVTLAVTGLKLQLGHGKG